VRPHEGRSRSSGPSKRRSVRIVSCGLRELSHRLCGNVDADTCFPEDGRQGRRPRSIHAKRMRHHTQFCV